MIMTIPRVLMAAALMVLGFMIWGIHKDVFSLTEEARGLRTELSSQISEVKGKVLDRALRPAPAPSPIPLPVPSPLKIKKHHHLLPRIHRKAVSSIKIFSPQELTEMDRIPMRSPPPPQHSNP
jgi:hypothetical protein